MKSQKSKGKQPEKPYSKPRMPRAELPLTPPETDSNSSSPRIAPIIHLGSSYPQWTHDHSANVEHSEEMQALSIPVSTDSGRVRNRILIFCILECCYPGFPRAQQYLQCPKSTRSVSHQSQNVRKRQRFRGEQHLLYRLRRTSRSPHRHFRERRRQLPCQNQ